MFDLEDFVENPEVMALSGLTKAHWLKLAAHYGLNPKFGKRKEEMRRLVLDDMIENELFNVEELTVLGHPRNLLALKQLEVEDQKLQVKLLRAENERLRLTQGLGQHSSEQEPSFKLETAMRLVPKFSEEDPEGFFTHFEKKQLLFTTGLWISEYY